VKNKLEKFLKNGIISQNQYDIMSTDVRDGFVCRAIIFLLSLGVVFTIVGTLWFLSLENHESMIFTVKVITSTVLVSALIICGFFLKKNNLKRTCSALVFLSLAFLAMALVLFLPSEIIKNVMSRLGICFVLILPVMYVFRSVSVAFLFCAVFITWFSLLALQGYLNNTSSILSFLVPANIFSDNKFYFILSAAPFIYPIFGIFLVCFGKLNGLVKDFHKIGAVFRKVGFLIICPSFSILAFSFMSVSGRVTEPYLIYSWTFMLANFEISVFTAAAAALFLVLLVLLFVDYLKKTVVFETIAMLLPTAFFVVSGYDEVPLIFTNLIFLFFNALMFFSGYFKKEKFFSGFSIIFTVLFLFAKYYDLVWNSLATALFFIYPGIIFILSGLLVEVKRRNKAAVKSENLGAQKNDKVSLQ
jgi:hypothetical protein